MAASKKTTHTKARAKAVASGGAAVRDRVRELSIRAFRDRNLTLSDVPKIVHEVLDGAVEGIDKSIPPSSSNVLREVFDGLSEGVRAVAAAGSAAVGDVRGRAKAVAGKNVPDAAKRISAANDEFLGAVRSFAGKTSKQVREDLDALVERAEKTGPKVTRSVREAAKAADGRLIELSGETARAGVRAARRAVGAVAMGAGGLLEGLAEAIAPKPARAAKASRGAPKRTAKKRSAKKGSKKARKKA
jgi:hypothetical protein